MSNSSSQHSQNIHFRPYEPLQTNFGVGFLPQAEAHIPPNSLAHRARWPKWATEFLADAQGRRALEMLASPQAPGDFYFLGMTALNEQLSQRVSQFTSDQPGKYGQYVPEPASKIGLVKDPAGGILRARITRHNTAVQNIHDNFGSSNDVNISEVCWSGWFFHKGRLQTITIETIARYMLADDGIGFVAVCNRNDIDPELIEEKPSNPLEINIRHPSPDFALSPSLIVPVGNLSLPPNLLVLGCNRTQAAEAYGIIASAAANGEIPKTVAIQNEQKITVQSLTDLYKRHDTIECTDWSQIYDKH